MSAEGHALQDAWMLADRALELAERACARLAADRRRPGADRTMNRTLDLALVLFNRAEALERSANLRPEQGNPS